MPQLQLPNPSAGSDLHHKTSCIPTRGRESSVFPRSDGGVPTREGPEDIPRVHQVYTSRLIAHGTLRQGDLVRAFKVPLATVKRYLKVHRQRVATLLPGRPIQRAAPFHLLLPSLSRPTPLEAQLRRCKVFRAWTFRIAARIAFSYQEKRSGALTRKRSRTDSLLRSLVRY